MKVYMSVVVMKMARSDIGVSGVVFTIDTESGFDDVVFINATYGIGETIVQGSVEPDSFYVHKPTLKKGYCAVLKRKLGQKAIRMIFANKKDIMKKSTKVVKTPKDDTKRFCISDDDVIKLAQYALKIEEHYGKSMDIEWAKDGLDGNLYIVQARPETVESKKKKTRY